ncbi:ribosomal protein S18-alanine N-acetyltransferase [Neisseriaceae bacterium TC5R-5]|nr:ribosomal protein S18-alanine N-acetyltransferase [Neisseriaceae bacterium TC5R-5]
MSSTRRFSPQYPDWLSKLEAEACAHPWRSQHYQDSLAANHIFFGIFAENQQLQGFAVLMQVLDEAELLNIVIAKPWQGQGLGKQLLSSAQQYLRVRAVKRLFLEVRASNQTARKLYLSCHFSEVGLRKNYYPSQDGREHAILMESTL